MSRFVYRISNREIEHGAPAFVATYRARLACFQGRLASLRGKKLKVQYVSDATLRETTQIPVKAEGPDQAIPREATRY